MPGSRWARCSRSVPGRFCSRCSTRSPRRSWARGSCSSSTTGSTQVRALGTGRLVKLEVKLGDEVYPDKEIGRISQDDLKDTIRETKARLERARRRKTACSRTSRPTRRRPRKQAIDRLKEAINQIIENSREGLGIAERIVAGSRRLRLISQLSNLDYLKDLQQKYTIKNDFNNGPVAAGRAGAHPADRGQSAAAAQAPAPARDQQAGDEAAARRGKARPHVANPLSLPWHGDADPHGDR